MPDLSTGLIYYAVFLFSTTVHEAAHAWVAKVGGDLTAYHGGQVSLDPRPHIQREPFGMVVLPLLSVLLSGWPFGFASAPYDPFWADRYPRRAAWMALAGPVSNLLLMLGAGLLMKAGLAAGVFQAPDSLGFAHLVDAPATGLWPGAGLLLSVFFSMNLLLATLNIIPLPPLDGSGALPLLLPAAWTSRYREILSSNRAMFSMVGMLAAWRLIDVLFDPVFLAAINLLHWGAHYG